MDFYDHGNTKPKGGAAEGHWHVGFEIVTEPGAENRAYDTSC
ncbi:hypothetical protein [Desulfosediminicola ganghwensis]|nr:hypothetical protein [Desulfosediminicola ganghwensis]